MLIALTGGRIVDPTQNRDAVGDLYIRDGRIVDGPAPGEAVDVGHDVSGRVVMAGAIDVHSHIAGGNVTLSRLLLPELHADEAPRRGLAFGNARWSTWETGRLYAEMGFTTVIEPALPPTHALQTHLELADVPVIDKGALTVVGNDDMLLKLLRTRESADAIRDQVAYQLAASRGLGLKVINAGGAPAFKSNVRAFGFDDEVPHYGVTSRRIVTALLDAAAAIGVPHPLHVHCNNLGVAGAPATVAATMAGAEGRPMHLAHVQFYAYAEDPDGGPFRSGAEAIVEALAAHPNVSVDVGQVMFGPTVTISLDIMKQYAGHAHASPKKLALVDGDAEGGGIVPIDYRRRSWVNQLQWAIGLEIFLLSADPWRCLMTTDHPNGGMFTTYPQIIHLLMDRAERARWIERMPAEAARRCGLAAIEREYTLSEVAVMTRAAPARLLGLADRGHLRPGAVADVAVYDDLADRAAMFAAARLVLKDGRVVVRDGRCLGWSLGLTHALAPGYDRAMDRTMAAHFAARYGVGPEAFAVPDAAFGERRVFEVAPCLT